MKKISSFFLIILILTFSSFCEIPKEAQTITVSGSGSMKVDPDTAQIYLSVEVLRRTAKDSQSACAELMNKVYDAMYGLGIPKKDIQTSNFNIRPQWSNEQNKQPKLEGYMCTNQINIKTKKLELISKIIDSAVSAGANKVSGLDFYRDDYSDYKNKVLDEAVKDAYSKASAIAAASGNKIKKVLSITESGADRPRISIGLYEERMASTPISPGQIEVSGNVTIVYQID